MSVTPSEDTPLALPGLVTKETPHHFSVLLLGEVVAVQVGSGRLIFHYTDGHKAYIESHEDHLHVGDYEVPTC